MSNDRRSESLDSNRSPTIAERVAEFVVGGETIGILGINAEFDVVYATEAAATLVSRTVATLVGKSAAELIHPDDLAMITESLQLAGEGRPVVPTIFRVSRPDGTWRHVEGTVIGLDREASDLWLVASFRDPTPTLSANDFVRASLSNDLVSAMAHLCRWIGVDSGFATSIHWRTQPGRFTDTFALDTRMLALAESPGVEAMLVDVVEQNLPRSGSLAELSIDVLSTDRRSYVAVPIGIGAVRGVLAGWAKWDRSIGPAGRAHLVRAANFATLALAKFDSDRELNHAARTDSLTGLSNRSGLNETLQRTFYNRERAALFVVDLNDFKSINDHHGHVVGDEVLTEVGRRMRNLSAGVSYRLGGDEFAVVCAARAAERTVVERELDECFRTPVHTSAGFLLVTASIGHASVGSSIDDPQTLMAAADRAMYASKRPAHRVLAS